MILAVLNKLHACLHCWCRVIFQWLVGASDDTLSPFFRLFEEVNITRVHLSQFAYAYWYRVSGPSAIRHICALVCIYLQTQKGCDTSVVTRILAYF